MLQVKKKLEQANFGPNFWLGPPVLCMRLMNVSSIVSRLLDQSSPPLGISQCNHFRFRPNVIIMKFPKVRNSVMMTLGNPHGRKRKWWWRWEIAMGGEFLPRSLLMLDWMKHQRLGYIEKAILAVVDGDRPRGRPATWRPDKAHLGRLSLLPFAGR